MQEEGLRGMRTGDSGWTVPWAMWVDRKRNCWLHPEYTLHPEPGGTVQMLVELREDGYHVHVPQGETFAPRDKPGYASPADLRYLPVTELHRRLAR